MMVTAPTAFVLRAWSTLSIASLASLVSAEKATDATIDPNDGLPPLLNKTMMTMTVTSSRMPLGQYGVAPLTPESILNTTNRQELSDVTGNLVLLGQSNFTTVPYSGNILYLSCDNNTDASYLSPDDMFNQIMTNANKDNNPAAILLYSTEKDYCYLSYSHLLYNMIWTMTSQEEAFRIESALTQTSGSVKASITADSSPPGSPDRSGGNSAIAMSILYSITGLITVLFLLIIATGAVRAHRNPERYGPRASTNGRPRRSRARGLAMAMLETLPIVKFGESDSPKPDEETGLENVSRAQTQQQQAPRAEHENTPNDAAVAVSSPEANGETSSQNKQGVTPASESASGGKANKGPEREEDHPGCSICTEDFTKGEDVRVLPCNHKFHPACVDPWLVNVSGTCPLCRLDLRPPEDVEPEEAAESSEAGGQPDVTETVNHNSHLAPPTEAEHAPEEAAGGEPSHRRRRSRLLDWNRLRHASVDERIQALRQYRQSQQGSGPASNPEDERRHSRLADRLRERFHIRNDSRSSATAPQSEPPMS